MKEYLIHFEFFGKNMKTKVFAESKDQAIKKVQSRVNVIKIKEQEDETVQNLKNIFGI